MMAVIPIFNFINEPVVSTSPFHGLSLEKLQELNDVGYTIVPDVLSNVEVSTAVTGIWEWLTTFMGAKPNDPQTWLSEHWPYDNGVKGVLKNYRSLSHSQAVWDVRQHPHIQQVFSQIWNNNDLLVSYDGVGIQRPPEITQNWSDPLGYTWHHIDQGSHPGGFQSVQGFINLIETTEEDGCLVVYPYSHLLHAQFHQQFPTFTGNWCMLENQHKQWFQNKGCLPIRVAAPAGSLVLWDSRVVHANATAVVQRKKPHLFRMVVYVCMTPRILADHKNIAKKRKYFEEGRVTNHVPHCIAVVPRKPNTYGNSKYEAHWQRDDQMWKLPQLTLHGYRLAGYG